MKTQYKKLIAGLGAIALMGNLAGCSSSSGTTPTETTATTLTGSFEGTGEGRNGDIKVTVTFTEGSITEITVDEHKETEGISDAAIETIPQEIIEAQSIAVDTVSGATLTSAGIIAAVTNAIENADEDIADWSTEYIKETVSVEDAECDVLVIGGGGAGMRSAIAAAEAGASVILVEKQGTLGGNTAMARGIFGCSNSSYQIAQGISVTTEDHLSNYLASYPNGDAEMLGILASNGGPAADWLIDNGMEFIATTGNYTIVPKDHRLGAGVLEICKEKLESYGVDIRLNTAGTQLLAENNMITGAIVETNGQQYTITAKSVIVTTGGFAANSEMVAEYNSIYANLDYICTPGDTGDGQVMAAAIGADLSYMDVMKCNPFLYYNEETGIYTMIGTYVNPGIVVNTAGNRIGNEHKNYYFSPDILTLDDPTVYLIYNEDVRNQLEASDITDVSYETIEELCAATGINASELEATLIAYKASAEAGQDEFGRTIFQNDLSSGPYYAVKLTPAMQGTFGGITINTNAQALNTEGNVINGLYAAGECAGDGLYGANPVPTDMVFGKIAGESAAEYALNN